MKIIIAASNMVHINNFHREYIDDFKKEGNEVLVLASGEGADLNIPFKKRAFSLKNALLSLKIRKIIKREKPDVIYLHTSLCAFWVRIALKGMKKCPLVVNTVHGYLFGNGYGKLHNKIYLLCEKILKKQTDYIVVMNDEDEKIAIENHLSLGAVYKINGMGIDFLKKEIPKASPSYPPKNLIYVGELNKRKNQIMLVRALECLPDCTLTLVGDGSERKSIEKYAKKHNLSSRLVITGFEKNIGKYIKEADLYVSASSAEGLPFNILEAIKAGLPVVASSVKGQTDLIPPEFLYAPNDIDKFVELVKNAKAQRIDIQKYEMKNAFIKNVEIYKACVGGLAPKHAEKS